LGSDDAILGLYGYWVIVVRPAEGRVSRYSPA